MKGINASTIRMIAPCGINCAVCLVFLRDKNQCGGCWGPDNIKPKHCMACSIKNCVQLSMTDSKFCYDCAKYPCVRLKQLDKRYKLKYNMSIIENQKSIKDSGLDNFVTDENIKWKCKGCGGVICVHLGYCMNCNKTNPDSK